MKYTLTCTDGNFTNTVEFEQDFLPSVLENMQLFLRGCGFYFDGTLDIINEDTEELYSDTHDFRGVGVWEETVGIDNIEQTDMFDSMDLQHAPNYYDTTRNK
jgi:hypothetical protein